MRAISSVLCVPFVLAAACTDFDTTIPEETEAAAEPAPVFATPSGFIDHADAVAGSYIVVLKPSRRAATRVELDATIDRLAAGRGASVTARYEHAVRGFAATMTPEAARALAADPDVEYVEANQRMTGDYISQSNATWGIDRLDQASLPLDTKYIALADAANVTAYVFDTGIRPTHTEFTGRLLPGFAGVADGQGTTDCNGHGTHVSGTVGGTVLGVAKKVSIVPVRVLGCQNGGTLESFIGGVDWVIANKRPRAVANMSIAFNPPNETVDNAVRRLVTNGVTVVVSAGNRNADACTQSPARVPEAITVGAIDKLDKRATFSNYGTCVDLFAPGVDIQAASYQVDNQLLVISGTSQASPHVAGIASLYLSTHPNATPAMVAAAIVGGATQNKVLDPVGSPNRLLSSKVVDSTSPTVAITAPASGATVDASFTVTAMAADTNLARVALKVDGVEVATAPAAPGGMYSLAAAGIAPGPHTLEVVATDLADLTATTTLAVTVRAADGPLPSDPSDPNAPTDEEPGDTSGGCNTSGGTPGILALAMALLAIRRRKAEQSEQL